MEPVELKKNVWWVANRSDSLLEVNVYLLTYPHEKGQANVMIDPGPMALLQYLQHAVTPIIGGLKNVNALLINHQDPDVAPNAASIQKLNPRCIVVASEDTWRLIRFFGLQDRRFKAVESYRSSRVTMPGGRQLAFVPSPFCHFRGAMMYYDVDNRILFSGDLFGGLSFSQNLFANKDSWEGMKIFHQLYMPSREALQLAITRIQNLDPGPEMIAPQHGSIIKGALVDDFMDRMYNLEVGLDLLTNRDHEENYLAAINEMFDDIHDVNEMFDELGENAQYGSAIELIIDRWNKDHSFTNVISFSGNKVTKFKTDPPSALKSLVKSLHKIFPEREGLINLIVMKALMSRNIPVGDILPVAEEEEMPADSFV